MTSLSLVLALAAPLLAAPPLAAPPLAAPGTPQALPAATPALSAPASAPASAAASAAWTARWLSTAAYVILPPRIQGNPDLVDDAQRQDILTAMTRDSARAIVRRYPQARVVQADQAGVGAVHVRPVLVAPASLLPWNSLTARLDFTLPGGQTVALAEQFGLMTLWSHQEDMAAFVYNRLASRLPR